MRSFRKNTVVVACIFGLGFSAIGCSKGPQGPVRAPVSGTVKLDGKPIQQGSILFEPAPGSKGIAAGTVIENGRYRLPADRGPTVGVNRIKISAAAETGEKPKSAMSATPMVQPTVDAVAPRFNTASQLTFEIKTGENTADFDVASR